MNCFAARTRNKAILDRSTSGGVFAELALGVLEEHGCVFGCALVKPDLIAKHIKISTVAELTVLHEPKYVQSSLGSTFKECRELLSLGIKVLYSGTPCQINALNKFLGKEYANLLTVDLICHGTPMRAVFDKYKEDVSRQLGEPLVDFSFRRKESSWMHGRLIAKGRTRSINIPYGESSYIRAFVTNLSLMPTCFKCPAKGDHRLADITLGDFWNIDRLAPSLYDDRGMSLVLTHTSKGDVAFKRLGARIESWPMQVQQALNSNRSYFEQPLEPRGRRRFLEAFKKCPMDELVERCLRLPVATRLIRIIRKVFSRACRNFNI